MEDKKSTQHSPINITVSILAILLVLSFIAWITSSALAKYVKEFGGSGIISTGDFDLSYQMRDPYLVDSFEELQEAVQYGYSYIRLTEPGDGIDRFTIPGEGTLALQEPLVIDLNGHTLVRNSTAALLSIGEGNTLTIIDTSKDQTGGFYNPVGSVFSIEGGRMLIMGGKIESGPRYWEYYSYKDNGTAIHQSRVDMNNMINVAVGENTASYPVIKYPDKTLGINGNIYFDTDVKDGETTIIPADTYCYFICSDGSENDATIDTTGADFHYSYYIDATSKEYNKEHTDADTDDIRVDIYGYNEVVASASSDNIYSAVDMVSGALVVNAEPNKNYVDTTAKDFVSAPRNMGTGAFISYFGVENTYGIYIRGGEMHVENAGIFTTVNPKTISDINPAAPAAAGRGICISTSADSKGALQIDGGVYRSYNNRTVNVLSGDIEIKGGTFDLLANFSEYHTGRSAVYVALASGEECKISDANFRIKSETEGELNPPVSVTPAEPEDTESTEGTGSTTSYASDYHGGNAYAVYVSGGTLDVEDTSFAVHGHHVTGIYAVGGKVNATGTNFTFGKNSSDDAKYNYTYGIYTAPSAQAIDEGTTTEDEYAVSFSSGSLNFIGEKSVGIYAKGGSVITDDSAIKMYGANSRGLSIEDGHIVSTDCTYEIYGAHSAAIQLVGGELYIHKSSSTATASTNASVHLYGAHSAAIYSEGGDILSYNIGYTLDGDCSYGIYATSGNVNFHDGYINLTSPSECYGIIGISEDASKPLAVDVLNSDIIVGGSYTYSADPNSTIDKRFGEFSDAERVNDSKHKVENRNPGMSGYYIDDACGASIGVFISDPWIQAHYEQHPEETHIKSHSYVSLYNSNLYSIDVGVAVRSGNVFLGGGGSLVTKNSSAVAITGGSVFVGRVKDAYIIEKTFCKDMGEQYQCEANSINIVKFDALDESGNGGEDSRPSAIISTEHNYYITSTLGSSNVTAPVDNFVSMSTLHSELNLNFTTPAPLSDKSDVRHFNVYDGIYINEGNFMAIDDVVINFTGLHNTKQTGPNDAYENSFAVRIKGGGLILRRAEVENSIGGGISVDGGNAYLGKDGDEALMTSKVSIKTTGNSVGTISIGTGTNGTTDQFLAVYNSATNDGHYHKNWRIRQNYTGGTGLRISGGNLTVYNANVETANGSAVGVVGSGDVTIRNGTFVGAIVAQSGYSQGGPGSYYGLKMFAGGTVNIEDGYFKGANGGAYVMGSAESYTVKGSVTITERAKVYIKKGTFEGSGGADAFTVGEGVDAYFGTAAKGELSDFPTAIQIRGQHTAISVNALDEGTVNTNCMSNVYIYYGTYKGIGENTFDSIFNGYPNVGKGPQKGNVYVYGVGSDNDTDDKGTAATSPGAKDRYGHWVQKTSQPGMHYYHSDRNIWYPDHPTS